MGALMEQMGAQVVQAGTDDPAAEVVTAEQLFLPFGGGFGLPGLC